MSAESTARTIQQLAGSKCLLVASTGGHLAQIQRLADMYSLSPESVYYTFDTEQSRSLLLGRRFEAGPYVAPRDLRGLAAATARLHRILRREDFDAVLSTGAGIAVSAAVAAAARRRRMIFVESISRFLGPSATGRVLQVFPSVERYTQHPQWANRWWRATPRVFAGGATKKREIPERAVIDRPLRVFVSLGTIRPYRFDALIDALMRTLRPEDHVTWQLGSTVRNDLPGAIHVEMPHRQFLNELSGCDVFVTHAGVGTVMQAIEMGKFPVVVPRSASRAEHVDEHQSQVAQMLASEHLAIVVHPHEITRDALLAGY